MRSQFLLAGLMSLMGAANCLRVFNNEVLENLRSVPEGWKAVGSPRGSTKMRFRIAVTQQNKDLFEETLLQVSTPSHEKYGKHLKKEELKRMIRPSQEATDSVLTWLTEFGIASDDIHENGEWINFVATVSQAEQMLNARFRVFESVMRPDVKRIRTLQYSVPRELHQHIDMIQPTTRFGQIQAERSEIIRIEKIGQTTKTSSGSVNIASVAALNVTSCNDTITPTCLKELYNFANFTADPTLNNTLGVNGFLEQYARYADLNTFTTSYAPWAKGANFSWTSVNGGKLSQDDPTDSAEANLDIQYTLSLSYPTKNNFYSTAGRGQLVPDLDQPDINDNSNEPYLEFFTYLLDQPDDQLPTVLSTSYGEDEQSLPESYSRNVCDMIGQLGMRGVTVVFSSGDTGVGSACQTNDGKNTTRFLPVFPASCPYVTSVGGTYKVQPERAISFSSGGFSDLWPTPDWQKQAVSEYLSVLGDQWKGLYNPEGRGFPDIAAQSYRYHIFDQGTEGLIGGTSASAPTISAIISNLNAARLAAGKPPMGWLNPWLYTEGYKGLTDIVDGGSRGCTGRSIYSGLLAPYVPYASWNATKGWDPVTGYGTPDFQKLLQIAMTDSTTYAAPTLDVSVGSISVSI